MTASAPLPPRRPTVLETERLRLCELSHEDAPFVLELLNDEDWLRFIGDKQVRTLEDARRYLEEGPIAMVRAHGHGLWRVDSKEDDRPAGVCGLLRREAVEDVDVGFGFLPSARGRGFATEAALATMDHARRVHGLTRVVGYTAPDNHRSARVLEKCGLHFTGRTLLPGEATFLHRFVRDEEVSSVGLRDVLDEDVPRFFEHQLDPQARHEAAFVDRDPTDVEGFLARWRRIRADETTRTYTVLVGDRVVGHVARFERDGVPEVTYWIARDARGRGVATAALGALLHRDPRRPLHARVAADHLASLRVLEKCGFEVVGRERAFAAARREEIDELLLELS